MNQTRPNFLECGYCHALVARWHVEHIAGHLCPICSRYIDLEQKVGTPSTTKPTVQPPKDQQ